MSSGSVLVFDLETIPDVAGLQRLGMAPVGLSPAEAVAHAVQARQAEGKNDFFPLYLQRVLVVGCLFRSERGIRIKCLGSSLGESDALEEPEDPALADPTSDASEAARLAAFFRAIDRTTPQLVSWNGKGFDAPVLQHRALLRGIEAASYWDQGEHNTNFRYNNYLARYQPRHLDLMDVLASYQARGSAPLSGMAQLCGFPGKLGMDGSEVWPAVCEGRLAEVQAYCETDVANTYLLYLRFERMRGMISAEVHQAREAELRDALQAMVGDASSPLQGEHWAQFLQAWRG